MIIIISAILLLCGLRPAAAASHIYYVKPSPSGSGDGSSWADATTLQDALGNATSGDEILVAAGTYVPGAAEADSFNLVPGVAMYGGFEGTETVLAERDWDAKLTILSEADLSGANLRYANLSGAS